MSTRFLRLDLSTAARDFQVVALEPGLPLLDRTNTTYHVLRKWLGRLVAEPEWHGESVDLFVCDDQGRRLHNVKCEPVAAGELSHDSGLRKDLEGIAERLKGAKPESDSEARVLKTIRGHFSDVAVKGTPSQRECHFFKYHGGDRWRLVWAWGYQRKDVAPAQPVICTNPQCSLLFVRRSGGSRNCPACEAASARPGSKQPRRKRRWLAVAVLLLVAAAAGYSVHYFWHPFSLVPSGPKLAVEPGDWTGPVGSRIEFVAKHTDSRGRQTDVSSRVVAVIENPKVLDLEEGGIAALVRAPGKTVVHFYLGTNEAHATLRAEPPSNPAKIAVEPAKISLGIGSTQQLRLWGQFKDGRRVDLTEAAEWLPVEGGNVYCLDGLLEGVSQGKATVRARYAATAGGPSLETSAEVNVAEERYTSLKLAVAPASLTAGESAKLAVEAMTDSGATRSLLKSSKLQISVDPPHVASVQDDRLLAARAGKGSLKASYQGLSATADFAVQPDTSPARFEVRPKRLSLVVGEVAELAVVTSGDDPVHVVSSAPRIVEVGQERQVIGRAVGTATLTVSQEARRQQVEVEVIRAKIGSIKLEPGRPKVPVDGSLPLRVVACCDKVREVNLAADQLVWERLPLATFADLDVKTLILRGIRSTGGSPQTMVCRCGDARATAQVEVVAPPREVEILPKGPVRLPVGQVTQLRAWANYGNGRRTELKPDRLKWRLDPAKVDGLELDPLAAVVRAKRPGVGPVSVYAEYQGGRSNQVAFHSVDAAPVSLALKADRTIVVVGDSGQVRAARAGEETAADLALEAVRYESSNPKLLDVDAQTGAYRAIAPGDVAVTASHPAAENRAELKLRIVQPDDVQLVLKPSDVRLRVGNRCELELLLVSGDRQERVSLSNPDDVSVAIGRPEAVAWKAPVLTGVAPAAPFAMGATYRGKTARATVEVLAASDKDGPPEIRVVPATAALAPGQSLSPRVQQRLPGDSDQWQEVEPTKVKWTVPPPVVWTPAAADLRPQLTLAKSAEGSLVVGAEYAGKTASLKIDVSADAAVAGPLVVVREPGGEELPVGHSQRYALMVDAGGKLQPAGDVRWQPAFENEHVRWDPPVLHAKKQGHVQRLTASAGKEETSFSTRIVGPAPEAVSLVPPRADRPASVRIVSDQAQPITIPVLAQFGDFRVEATFDDGTTSNVTRDAALAVETDNSDEAPVAVAAGTIIGQRSGQAVVQAEYNGVRSKDGLAVVVADELALDAIDFVVALIEMEVGESVDLQATGFLGEGSHRRNVGDVTMLAGLTWESDKPSIARIDGTVLTGVSPGSCTIAVRSGGAVARARVVVTAEGQATELAGNLEISPRALHMQVGETKWIGTDVTLRRGDVDLSRQMEVTSAAPSIVAYDRDNRSLTGMSPGTADLAITLGGRRFTLPVHVQPAGEIVAGGSIAVEPAGGDLAVGEGLQVRVIHVGADGRRSDRTGSAVLSSSDPAILAVSGSRVTGMAEGQATLSARLAGLDESAAAAFTVRQEDFTDLAVTPPAIRLGVGERASFRVTAVGHGGRRELADHPDLKLGVVGDNPGAIELQGANRVRGVSPGRAAIQVSWRGLPARTIDVEVVGRELSDLRIEPADLTVEVGRTVPFVVFAKRGRYEKALSADDGVEVQINDPSVAELGDGFTVAGRRLGTSELVARLGSQRAVAKVNVTSEGPIAPRPLATGLQFVPNVLTLQLGVPGASVRLVKVSPDGRQEDVDHRAVITIHEPKDIVGVEGTASGPVFVPKKEGQTQATARQGNLTTLSPLMIQVLDPRKERERAFLRVSPDPVYLTVGETGRVRHVELVPGIGRAPIEVDYQIEPSDDAIVRVEGGKTLRGVAGGQTRLRVRPVDVGDKYKDLTATVAVEVEDVEAEAAEEGVSTESQLLLTGPSHATAGEQVGYRVELVRGRSSRDVTHDATTLVLDRGRMNLAEVLPGCVLAARRPGTVTVRARHEGLISEPVLLEIDPLATAFARLELAVDRRPLAVGEVRSYRVWGYPAGGGDPQDLTGSVTADRANRTQPRVVAYSPGQAGEDTPLAVHTPPTIVGKSPGRFLLEAALGSDLRSDAVEVEVVDEGSGVVGLDVQPASISIGVGERTPPLKIVGRRRADGQPQSVNAQVESENPDILAPDAQQAACFVGRGVGRTRIRATYGGQEAFVDVHVVPNPLQSVVLDENPDYSGGGRFSVFVNVEGSAESGRELEYRVVSVGNPDQGAWQTATREGTRLAVRLRSPELSEGPAGTVYCLKVQTRDKSSGQLIAQYPLDFTFTIDPRVRPQP